MPSTLPACSASGVSTVRWNVVVLLAWLTAAALLSGGQPIFAQDPMPPATTTPPLQEEPPVALKNADGKLVQFPGLTYEQYRLLVEQVNNIGAGAAIPKYNVKSISCQGEVLGDYARLQIQFEVQLQSDAWVEIPLRLDEAVLDEPESYSGSGQHFLEFPDRGGGYIFWVRDNADKVQQLKLTVLLPVEESAGENRLRLTLPRNVQADMELKVPVGGAEGRIVGGTLPVETKAAKTTDNKPATQFTAKGLRGQVDLAWHAAQGRLTQQSSDLKVAGLISCTVDRKTIRSDARLTVRSFGGPFSKFKVKLPIGSMLLNAEEDPRIQVPAGRKPATIDVALDEPTAGPVELHLVTEQEYDETKPDTFVELGAFQVIGAVRESGLIALHVTGDRHVLWESDQRQVESVPQELQGEDLVAAFEYWRQPAPLKVQILPRQPHVRVDPSYVVEVSPGQVKLQAVLRYNVDGAKEDTFQIHMPGWEIDQVSPASLVDMQRVVWNKRDPFALHLRTPGQSGPFEITLDAHQKHRSDQTKLGFQLPYPEADTVVPAAVVVVPADNVSLLPHNEGMQGLIPQRTAFDLPLPPSRQAPWHFLADGDAAHFEADFHVHTRKIQVGVDTQIRLNAQDESVWVEQTFDYEVEYEPLTAVTLEVPRNLSDGAELKVMLDEQVLTPIALLNMDPSLEEPIRVRAAMPPPGAIGDFKLKVLYRQSPPELIAGASTEMLIPLVMPGEGELLNNDVTISARPGIDLRPHVRGDWEVISSEAASADQLRLYHDGPAEELPFMLRVLPEKLPGSTQVDRAWIQIWLADSVRHDRVAYRFSSTSDRLEIQLPEAATDPLRVALDGRPIAVERLADQKISLRLPASINQGEHTLELLYRVNEERARLGTQQLAAPVLGDRTWIERSYWQFVLPDTEHLLKAPAGLTPENVWRRQGWVFSRKPVLDQAQLENWIGVAHRTAVPDQSNQYLYSTLEMPADVNFYVGSRTALVGVLSLVVLLAGLGFLYVTWMRRPTVVFILVVLLAALGLEFPEPALLTLQAASLGVACALGALLLRRLLRREEPEEEVGASMSSFYDRGSTEAHQEPIGMTGRSSTLTAAGVAADADS